jgi:hypothetical protein
MHWEHWLGDLNEAAEAKGYQDRPLTETTGEDKWRVYFDRGLSPGQALDEDLAEAEMAGRDPRSSGREPGSAG